MLRALAQRLRRANDVTGRPGVHRCPGRVAKALLDLADRFGQQTDEGLQVHHDLTQEELAQLVGASRETVNKALADFAARGWLTHRGPLGADRRPRAAAQARPLSDATAGSSPRLGQVVQLGPDRQLGRRPERPVDVGVDPGHDLGGRRAPGGQRRPDLVQPSARCAM